MLDLTEHGLDCLFPQPVATTVPTPTKLLPHRVGVGAKLDLSLSKVRTDKPMTALKTTVTRDDGTVVLDGETMCYTMPLPQRRA